MKRLATALALLSVARLATAAETTRADKILDELHDPGGRVLVVAHRGDWRNHPENSVRAVLGAIDMGVDIVEIDLRTTADGHFVVIHDKTLDRTTTGSGKVCHHTLEQIRELRLLNGYGQPTDERVPTLEEVLEVCRGRALLYLDKTDGRIAEAYEAARRVGMARYALFYGHKPAADLRAELGPQVDEIVYLPKLGDETVNPDAYIEGFRGRTPAFVTSFARDNSPVLNRFEAIRHAGARVWVSPLWPDLCAGRTDDRAIDDPEASWGWLLDRGASILCTDRPERLIDYLFSREIGGER